VGNINGNDDILNELYGYNLFLFNNGSFVKDIYHYYLYIFIMNISECIRVFLNVNHLFCLKINLKSNQMYYPFTQNTFPNDNVKVYNILISSCLLSLFAD